MKKGKPTLNSLDKRRTREEWSAGDYRALLEELRAHQIELEMKNEALRRAYAELEKAKEIYSDLYDFAPGGYITLDQNNLIFRVNLAGADLLGLERSRLLGKNFPRFISPGMKDRFYHHRRRCLDTGRRRSCELIIKGKGDDDPRYVRLESVAVPGEEGHPNRLRSAMIDITDQKKAEEQIRMLSREMLISQEAERQMISRELHDGIAQDLSAVKMRCESLMSDHPEIPEELRRKTSELSKMLQRIISEVRDLSYSLRPPDMERGDIIQSMSNLCGEFSRNTGIEADFHSAGMENITLDDFSTINIYRLVQEGLNNVKKHAEAKKVNLTFSYSKPDLLLHIIDNGRGFDMEKRMAAIPAEKRMGLRSMGERVGLLGGTMEVRSKVMHGTMILIKLPYGGSTHG